MQLKSAKGVFGLNFATSGIEVTKRKEKITMMTMKRMLVAPALIGALLAGCNDDTVEPTQQAEVTFGQMYPEATNVEWETEGDYRVAEFRDGGFEKEAWFDRSGSWQLTETDLAYADLPEEVRTAHESGDFADWTVDDVDFVERNGRESLYVLEVERGNTEYDLYYLEDGTLVKSFADTDNDNNYLPTNLPNNVTELLNDRYPDHRIIDVETDDNRITVELLDGSTHREADFATDGSWIRTETDVRLNAVPDAVLDALAASEYSAYRVDDIDFIETPDGNYYQFELESRDGDVDITIDEAGNVERVN